MEAPALATDPGSTLPEPPQSSESENATCNGAQVGDENEFQEQLTKKRSRLLFWKKYEQGEKRYVTFTVAPKANVVGTTSEI